MTGSGDVAESEEKEAADWAATMGELFQRVRLDLIHDVLAEALAAPPTNVLDVGCGTGESALRFAAEGAKVLAVDRSEPMLRRLDDVALREGLSVTTLCTELSQLDELGMAFDLVMCHNVLGFVTDAPEAISLLARQVAPGGHLSLVVNNAVRRTSPGCPHGGQPLRSPTLGSTSPSEQAVQHVRPPARPVHEQRARAVDAGRWAPNSDGAREHDRDLIPRPAL